MIRFFAVVLLLSAGCAKGSAGDEGDDRVTVDASGIDGGGGRRDSGPGGRDMFVEGCDDDAYPDECASAEDLGEFMPGAEMVINGVVPTLSDEDWFAVRFPPNMSGAGGGAPTVELVGDDTIVMTVEGPTCGPRAHCGEGSAGAITSYSFTDDADDSVEFPYSSRMVDWPESLFIRIHRSGGPATCTEYALTITR